MIWRMNHVAIMSSGSLGNWNLWYWNLHMFWWPAMMWHDSNIHIRFINSCRLKSIHQNKFFLIPTHYHKCLLVSFQHLKGPFIVMLKGSLHSITTHKNIL